MAFFLSSRPATCAYVHALIVYIKFCTWYMNIIEFFIVHSSQKQ